MLEKDPIDEELQAHFEALVEERIEAGDSPEEAARWARHRLGHRAAIEEEVRSLSLRHRVEAVVRHSQFALRSFHRHGGAYVLATVILSIGIALSVALFSLVDAVVFASLPYPDQDRVHLIWKTDPKNQPHLVGELAYPELGDLQSTIPGIEAVGLFPAAPYGNGRVLQVEKNEAVQLESCPASPDFFRALGVKPAIGRDFEAGDSAAGAARVVILSDRVWRERFGGRPGVVNEPVMLNGRAHTVIGVMPAGFDFPRGMGLWVNLPAAKMRGMTWLQAVARVKPGVDRDQLQRAVDRTFRMQIVDHPKEYVASQRAVVTPIDEFLTGTSKPQLLLSLIASVLLLGSAWVSAGNLFLSRTLARRQEVATRISLGATPGQILSQFAVEALVAAAIASLAGAVMAVGLIRVLILWAPPSIPRIENATLSPMALGFAAGMGLVAALACGLGPALLLRKSNLEAMMRDGGARMAGSLSGGKLQRGFVFLQAALTVAILACCGMLFESYRAMLNTDIGLGNRDALTVNLTLAGPRVNPESYRAFYIELIDRLRARPEVSHAAGVLLRPLEGSIGWDASYELELDQGRRDPAHAPKANFEVVSSGYFAAIGTPLLSGRDFNEHDSMEAEKVVVISKSLAKHFQDLGVEPLGQRLKVFDAMRKVVGVVADARYRGVVQAGEDVYLPHRQIDIPTKYLVVRGRVPAGELLAFVRGIVKEMDPQQAIAGEATLGELIDRNTARDRFNVLLLMLFAVGATVLAALGIHSVMREAVMVRAKEIAVRMALGAGRGGVAFQTTRRILMFAGSGVVGGVVAALFVAPLAVDLLYGVSPREPRILLGVACFVAVVAVASAVLPAWRASGEDPRKQLV
jgi:putative ABC transport system permease protein